MRTIRYNVHKMVKFSRSPRGRGLKPASPAMANLQTLSQRAFSRYQADSLPIGRSKTERHRTRRGTSGRCQSPAWLVGNRPPKSSLESAAAPPGLVYIIGHTVTLRRLRADLKFLHFRTGLRRPTILDLFVVPECDQPWTPGACSDYGQPTGRSRHRIDFFLCGSSRRNFRPRHEERSMVMVFARADTQKNGFIMWDFAFPAQEKQFPE